MLRGTFLASFWGSPHGLSGDSPMNVGFLDGHVKTMQVQRWATMVQQQCVTNGGWW